MVVSVHPDEQPSPNVSLRYKYEKWAEGHFTIEKRRKHPWKSLRTFNILIPREIALRFPFDESILGYGYEDVLLGRKLEKEGVSVLHINNPLLNTDIEDNTTFLCKTEEALRTLWKQEDKIQDSSSLISFYKKLDSIKALPIVRILYHLFSKKIRKNLTGKEPNILLFQFYKIAYFDALHITAETKK